jgi:hypothetical protein
MYLIEFIFTLFAKSLPLDPVAWIWDQVLVLGDQCIFQVALGLLSLLEKSFFTMNDLSDVAAVLKDLSGSPILAEALMVDGEPLKKRERWRPLYTCVEAQKIDSTLWAAFLKDLQRFEETVLHVENSPRKLAMRMRASVGDEDPSEDERREEAEQSKMAEVRYAMFDWPLNLFPRSSRHDKRYRC